MDRVRNGSGEDDDGPRTDPAGSVDPAVEVSALETALSRIAAERREAPLRLAELLGLPAAERRQRLQNDPRCRTLGLCELVVQRGLEQGFGDPRQARETAELGIEIASRLDPAYYGDSIVHDLLARAWAYLGNARRVSSDLVGAEQALERAAALLPFGSGDPLEEARLLDFQTSLFHHRGRSEEALVLQGRVLAICEELNDPHRTGRALIKQGFLLGDLERYAEAVAATERALALVEPTWEPRLLLMARHNLLWFLNESGHGAEALAGLERLRQDYLEFPDPWTLLRFDWLHAQILARLDHRDEAAALLAQVHRGFLDTDRLLDAAWAALELALLLLELGRPAEAEGVARAAMAVFVAGEARLPALAARLLHTRAANRDAVR